MEHQERITGALSAWTEDLLPALNILGNTELDDQVFTTTFRDYTAVEPQREMHITRSNDIE